METESNLDLQLSVGEKHALWTLTRDSGEKVVMKLTPSTLPLILNQLMALANHWAEASQIEIGTVAGPGHVMHAHHISTGIGRDTHECALTIHVGAMPLVFLMPVQAVIEGLLSLKDQVMPTEGPPQTAQ